MRDSADTGQRYVVQALGWPQGEMAGWQDCAFSNSRRQAGRYAKAVKSSLSVEAVRMVDREPEEIG